MRLVTLVEYSMMSSNRPYPSLFLSYINTLSRLALSAAYGRSDPSSTKSTSRPSSSCKSISIPPWVKSVKGLVERSGTNRISTSLIGVSSPRAKEPKSQAFRTGCVLKYYRLLHHFCAHNRVVLEFNCKDSHFFLKTQEISENFEAPSGSQTSSYRYAEDTMPTMTLPHQGLDQSEKRPLHPSFIELSVSWQSLLA